MKLLHLSDLHLGKRVNEFSMLQDQDYILCRILDVIDAEKPHAVLVAGDVYDKAVPPAEAVMLFDSFLVRLAARSIPVLIISGNHDSPERIAFGAQLMHHSGVYLSPVYTGKACTVSLHDSHGTVDFFLLPFLKPAHLRRCFPQEEIATYTQAVECAIRHMQLNPQNRSVLVTHQFVTGAARCGSEEISVGGSDNVDAGVFDAFDYVALGHIHGAQSAGRELVRYCGTPLKYSFSEAQQQKSVTVVELAEKGRCTVATVPLTPLRDLLEIKGSYMELAEKSYYQKLDTNAYYHVTLTDEEDVPYALGKLRAIYPNIMKLDYDNKRTRAGAVLYADVDVVRKSPLEVFGELFEKQNGSAFSQEQKSLAASLIEKIWEGEVCDH